jgi:hypothetical protein
LIKACLETCDMLRPPAFIAPWRSGKTTRREPRGSGSWRSLNRV